MSTQIKNGKNTFIVENSYVSFEVSKKDARVVSVVDKATGSSIKRCEDIFFFELFDRENNALPISAVELDGNTACVTSEYGNAKVTLEAFDDHFIFEIIDADFSDKVDLFTFAKIGFEYDLEDNEALRACDIAMTISANPHFYPDGYSKEIKGSAVGRFGGFVGAKLGALVVPNTILREKLKVICEKIDPQKGIVSKIAGPWALDYKPNFGDYIIVGDASKEALERNLPLYKDIDVDQIDFHQGPNTFRQGDFKYMAGETHEEFKKNVADPLKENGMMSGLHTYSYYIKETCLEVLSDPKNQKMLDTEEEFTLAEDIAADDMFIPSVEPTDGLSKVYGFFVRNLPFCIIGEEIIRYRNHPHGFTVLERGVAGTKPTAHKKGDRIYHCVGCFGLFAPKPDSDLYLDVARFTAEAYNKGGFDMVYLDALDGINRQCRDDFTGGEWYYCARFVHGILKHCNHDPIIEYSTMYPSLWSARARSGAWDSPTRSYKRFNMAHHKEHALFRRRHYTATLGWYCYYPVNESYHTNQLFRYHHWDAVDHMGTLAIMYNYSTVYNDVSKKKLEQYPGYRRNVELYKKYNALRKSGYFKESTLEKLRASKHEFKLVDKGNGKWCFIEKNYDTKRLYDIQTPERAVAEFSNPFKAQKPFIRIESCMSSLGRDPMMLLPLDENRPLSEQLKVHEFGGEVNVTDNMALKVRVKGNGKKGTVSIKTRYATNGPSRGYALYLIDTDFKGWRDFTLFETDNGTRDGLKAEDGEHLWRIYRNPIYTNRLVSVELYGDGDIEGVQMSSITACRHTYDVIKNPKVKIGDEEIMFECELTSTDFIEWDGEKAVVLDRYANEKPIWFTGSVTAPKGKYKAELTVASSLNNCPVNAILTFGTTGKEVK